MDANVTKLPFVQPDRELHYNLGILLLILDGLAKTKRQKKVLTIDKMQTFYFLATRPAFLNKVFSLADKGNIDIDDTDYYTVDTLSANVDELFDREKLLIMIRILSANNLISVEYDEADGFLFDLSEAGKSKADNINDGYFRKARNFINQLSLLQSQSASKLNGLVNTALKQGI